MCVCVCVCVCVWFWWSVFFLYSSCPRAPQDVFNTVGEAKVGAGVSAVLSCSVYARATTLLLHRIPTMSVTECECECECVRASARARVCACPPIRPHHTVTAEHLSLSVCECVRICGSMHALYVTQACTRIVCSHTLSPLEETCSSAVPLPGHGHSSSLHLHLHLTMCPRLDVGHACLSKQILNLPQIVVVGAQVMVCSGVLLPCSYAPPCSRSVGLDADTCELHGTRMYAHGGVQVPLSVLAFAPV